jgi:hypothetical protein
MLDQCASLPPLYRSVSRLSFVSHDPECAAWWCHSDFWPTVFAWLGFLTLTGKDRTKSKENIKKLHRTGIILCAYIILCTLCRYFITKVEVYEQASWKCLQSWHWIVLYWHCMTWMKITRRCLCLNDKFSGFYHDHFGVCKRWYVQCACVRALPCGMEF